MLLLIVVIGAGLALRGIGGGGNDGGNDTPRPNAPEVATQRIADPVPPAARVARPPGHPIIPVLASDSGSGVRLLTVDRLEPQSIVQVRAAGFMAFERGFVQECVAELGHLTTCTGRFPVQFGEDGGADFQYQIPSSSAPGGCRYGQATCTLEVRGTKSTKRGEVQIVVGEARAGKILVSSLDGVRDGQALTVSVSGFPANTPATAMLCALVGGYDVRHCGIGPGTAALAVGADGSGRANLVADTGAIGADSVQCGPRNACGVLVVTQEGFVAAPAVPLHFSLGPGASYNGSRLAVGLSLGGLLVVVAIILVWRTDWTKPTEAATPEVDAADLETDKSLDELFGTDEELDARDPLPF